MDKITKREYQLMEEEKRYYADIKITWGVSFNARNKEEAIEYLKEQYKDDYGIDLNDDEIIKLEEGKMEWILKNVYVNNVKVR